MLVVCQGISSLRKYFSQFEWLNWVSSRVKAETTSTLKISKGVLKILTLNIKLDGPIPFPSQPH